MIASHEMRGFAWVPDDVTQASFEVHVPVQTFTIDEPSLRALEGTDFSAEVPDSAREGTRRNMLSPDLLDGEHFPEIVLKSAGIGGGAGGEVVAAVNITIRGVTNTVAVPLGTRCRVAPCRCRVSFPLQQTALGLTPFSLFGGALRVEDEMRVKVFVVARGAG